MKHGDSDVLLAYEQGVIGNIFLHFDECIRIKTMLSPDDFTASVDYRRIYCCFIDHDNEQKMQDEIIRSGLLEAYAKSSDNNPYVCSSQLEYCVNMLLAEKQARQIRTSVLRILGETTSEELPAILLEYTSNNAMKNNLLRVSSQEESIMKMINGLTEKSADKHIFTGFPKFDRLVNGLQIGNISVLGALPSSGKTAFATCIVRHCVRTKKRVIVFTLEMGETQIWERLLANLGDISYESIVRGRVSEESLEIAKKVMIPCSRDLVYVFDDCLAIEAMASLIMKIKPDLVIVDFLQYVRVNNIKHNSVADKLEYIVSEFKRIAKLSYCPCHIMILSQHNRGEKGQDAGRQASMFSLKGSSGIEQGGDYIMILDRPCVRDRSEAEQKASLLLVKNKFGRLGNINLFFDGDKQRFREMAEEDLYPKPIKQEWIGDEGGVDW